MRNTLLLILLIIGQWTMVKASENAVYQGFSGGMMLHTGYLFGQEPNAPYNSNGQLCSPEGATFGIGGALRVNLWNHLRIGGEGFASTMHSTTTNCSHLLQPGSYIRTGCGGFLTDACWRMEKVWPYLGGTIGGGANRSFYLLEGNQNDWQEETHSLFHKETFCYVDPYIGLDWCVTQKTHLTFRMDWIIAFHKKQMVFPTGPRLYVGFMFCH